MTQPEETPIGGGLSVPPQSGVDTEHLTQDIMSALERAVLAKIDARAAELGITRRQAAARVLAELRAGSGPR